MISNGVYLLVSHPKVGKSMFAQQLAFSLTTGEDFLGFKVNPSYVLYITTEGDINQLQDRFKVMNLKPNVDKLHIIDIDDIPDFYIRDVERDIHKLTFDKEPLFVIIDMLKDIKFDSDYNQNDYQEINNVVFKKFISYEDDLRWKCVFEIFYYCGLRKGELKGLTWKDIYFDKKVLSVNKQITQLNNRTKFEFSDTKTKDSYRIVPITKVLLNDFKTLYEQCKKEYYNFNDDFFVVSDARPIADSTIYDRRTKLAETANLKSIRLHDFRHSCASLLINNGANVTLVAKYLGHTKIEETLNTYSHMFSTALDSVVSVIDSLEDD